MVNNFLADNFTVERCELIADAINVLGKFNSVDIINELENIISDDDNISNIDMIAMVNGTVVDAVLDILNAHGVVTLDLTRDIKLLTNMMNTLKLVSEEYDPSFITDAVDLELTELNDAIAIWTNLVVLVTDSDEHDILVSLFEVEDTIINNITTVLANKTVDLPPDDDRVYVTRYRKFLNGRRTGDTYDLVRGGLRLGSIDFTSLFLIIDDNLYNAPPKEQVFEVLSLLMVSDAEPDEFIGIVENMSRVLTDDEFAGRVLLSEIKEEYLKQTGTSL